jgi:hypothetical protein
MAAPNVAVTSNDVEWAKHLFDEWKYRHENFWKTLYRALFGIAVLTTLPFVKAELFKPLHDKNISLCGCTLLNMRAVYGFLPTISFIALCFVLSYEHARLRAVEEKLQEVRGRNVPTQTDRWAAFRPRTFWPALTFVVGGLAFLAFWWSTFWQL